VSNNQEMQFAEPDWQPKTLQEEDTKQVIPPGISVSHTPSARPIGNTQQTNETEQDYTQGYRAQTSEREELYQQGPQQQPFSATQQPFSSAQQQPWYQRMPIWGWGLLALAILGISSKSGPFSVFFSLISIGLVALVIWLLVTRRVTISTKGEKQQPETHTFSVGAQPTIIVNSKAGAIRLHTGEEGEVKIVATKRGYIFNQRLNSDAQIWYNQDNTKNTVSARVDSWRPFGKNAIDFDITVPVQANLQITANAGNIVVQNVTGQMVLKADVGAIRAEQVVLSGRSRLRANLGTIYFTGSLDPSGDYDMTTDLGSVNANLPDDASFHLEAKTDVGAVNTNLILGMQKRDKASGNVGTGPNYPRLRLKTDMGSVSVYRGSKEKTL